MRSLTTSDGTPTNGVYAFVMMLWYILEHEQPDAIFAAFDPPTPTFRHIELPTYKSNRLAAPPDLKPQRSLARDAARAFRIPVVEIDGFEADDVCGTLAEIGKHAGFETLIVTGDGDALQLVDDTVGPVKVMITSRGVTETKVYDRQAVWDRYGLEPSQIPDYKAIKGDPSDNLPGIKGIGDKGASKLLQEFGTIESVVENIDRVLEKFRPTIEEHASEAIQSKRLATIIRDVTMPEWVQISADYKTLGPDFDAVKALFDKLEFHTLNKRLPQLRHQYAEILPLIGGSDTMDDVPMRTIEPGKEYSTAEDIAAFFGVIRGQKEPIGLLLDLAEPGASSLMAGEIAGVAISAPSGTGHVRWEPFKREIGELLSDANVKKVLYDYKTTYGRLLRSGVHLNGVVDDVLLSAYLLNAGRSGYPLRDIVAESLKIQLLDTHDLSLILDSASCLVSVRDRHNTRMEDAGLMVVYRDIEVPLSKVIAEMELRGVAVDAGLLTQVSQSLSNRITALEAEIYAIAGEPFSVGSTKQLQEVLFEKLKLPAGKKTKTGYSTGADVLETLAADGHTIAAKVIEWRELSKLKSTYADNLPQLINSNTGRIHTSLNQAVTSTGRLSSSNPNLQNIPIRTEAGREIRKAFVAEGGRVLVSADYSQIELRIFAHLTRDAGLLDAFASDTDIHSLTARLIFDVPADNPVTKEQRRQAKTVNFAVIYGAGPFRVAAELGISQARACELIKAYLARYPMVRAYTESILDGARANGYVSTALGRRRYTPDIHSRVFQFRQAAEREAGNMPIQGASADLIKLAMLRVDEALRASQLDAFLVLQVHDELLFECAPSDVPSLANLVREAMENAMALSVPIRTEVHSGANWWEVTPVLSDDSVSEIGTDQ